MACWTSFCQLLAVLHLLLLTQRSRHGNCRWTDALPQACPCVAADQSVLHSLEIVLEQRFLRPQVRMCYSGGVWLSVRTWLSCRYHHMLPAGTKTLTEHKSKDSLRRIIIFSFWRSYSCLSSAHTVTSVCTKGGEINTWASLRFNWLGVILWQINVPLIFVRPTQVLRGLQIMNIIYLVLGDIKNASLLIWF